MKKLSLPRSGRTLVLMGTLLAVPVAVKLGTHASWAQSSAGYGQKAGKIADDTATAAKKLNLTDEQKAQIKAIMQKYAPQIHAIATDATLSDAEKKAALEKLRASIRTEVDAVLTPQQKAQLDALRNTVKRQVTALLTQIGAQLNLTEDQKSSIQSIVLDARLQAAAIITDESLSRSDKRSELTALRTKTRGAIMAVLTSEQQSKLEAILNQIRPVLTQRAKAWRASGGLGLGLTQ